MTGYGKPRKTKPRFPSASHSPWKSLRDFHIPTALRRRVPYLKLNPRKEALRRVASLPRLQAHSSMRICFHPEPRAASEWATLADVKRTGRGGVPRSVVRV